MEKKKKKKENPPQEWTQGRGQENSKSCGSHSARKHTAPV